MSHSALLWVAAAILWLAAIGIFAYWLVRRSNPKAAPWKNGTALVGGAIVLFAAIVETVFAIINLP